MARVVGATEDRLVSEVVSGCISSSKVVEERDETEVSVRKRSWSRSVRWFTGLGSGDLQAPESPPIPSKMAAAIALRSVEDDFWLRSAKIVVPECVGRGMSTPSLGGGGVRPPIATVGRSQGSGLSNPGMGLLKGGIFCRM